MSASTACRLHTLTATRVLCCAALCRTALCRVACRRQCSEEVRAALVVLILVLVLVFRVRVASRRVASHSLCHLSPCPKADALLGNHRDRRVRARRPAIIWCIRHEIERAQWALAPASADENSVERAAAYCMPCAELRVLCAVPLAQCFAALFAASVLNFAQISSSTAMRLYANSSGEKCVASSTFSRTCQLGNG